MRRPEEAGQDAVGTPKSHAFAHVVAAVLLTFLAVERAPAQSTVGEEMFDPVKVVEGFEIDRRTCWKFEDTHTAVWVEVRGQAACLRYYAWGLVPDENPTAAVWLNGDVLGPRGNNAGKRQKGFGPALMVAEQKKLAEQYHVPSIFVGRPGTYGSAGRHHAQRGRQIEADLVDAGLDQIKGRYGIGSFALGGHSGGGTLVAELLSRRTDLKCAVISSGAGAYRAFLEKRGIIRPGQAFDRFDPIESIGKIPKDPRRRIFVIGDPRETNIPFSTQKLYSDALTARQHQTFLVPLRKATDARYHNLVDFGRAATGLCASGANTHRILRTLQSMPEQQPRVTN